MEHLYFPYPHLGECTHFMVFIPQVWPRRKQRPSWNLPGFFLHGPPGGKRVIHLRVARCEVQERKLASPVVISRWLLSPCIRSLTWSWFLSVTKPSSVKIASVNDFSSSFLKMQGLALRWNLFNRSVNVWFQHLDDCFCPYRLWLIQLAYLLTFVFVTVWLLHIYCLVQLSVLEDSFDYQLLYFQIFWCCDGQNCSNLVESHYGAESLVVYSCFLSKATGN